MVIQEVCFFCPKGQRGKGGHGEEKRYLIFRQSRPDCIAEILFLQAMLQCANYPLSLTEPDGDHWSSSLLWLESVNQEERMNREESLLNAALDCYAGTAWPDVTIADIARSAGVAKGTVYLHFKSKDEILAQLTLQFYEGLLNACSKPRQTADKAGGNKNDSSKGNINQLEQVIDQAFSYYRRQVKFRRVVQYCEREHFRNSLEKNLSASLQNADHSFRSLIDKCLQADAKNRYRAAHSLNGVCCTLQGALQQFWNESDTGLENQMKCMNSTTNYILGSVGHTASV